MQYSFKVNVNFNNSNNLSTSISCSATKSKLSTNSHPSILIKRNLNIMFFLKMDSIHLITVSITTLSFNHKKLSITPTSYAVNGIINTIFKSI